jgi:hypothetical protein
VISQRPLCPAAAFRRTYGGETDDRVTRGVAEAGGSISSAASLRPTRPALTQ